MATTIPAMAPPGRVCTLERRDAAVAEGDAGAVRRDVSVSMFVTLKTTVVASTVDEDEDDGKDTGLCVDVRVVSNGVRTGCREGSEGVVG